MSRTRSTGLPAGEVVLGLLIEQPDHGFSLERRLKERFAAARFAYSTAYSALRPLKKDGLVRVVEADAAPARRVIYEATPEGVEHLRNWVRAPTSATVWRAELHAKIALCEPRDLPRLIDIVYAEELACMAELDHLRERAAEQRLAPGRAIAEEEWSKLMDRGVVHDEAAFWGGRITQLAQLRSYLEELREEAERRALQEHRRGLENDRRAG
jgi:DNA-binding PadR family transcriptional regulator